jgi:hypothetical protein
VRTCSGGVFLVSVEVGLLVVAKLDVLPGWER